jgi:hypothetical protein
VLLGILFLFSGLVFYEWKSGKVYGRGGLAATKAKQPFWYWFGIAYQSAILVAFFLWWLQHRPLKA